MTPSTSASQTLSTHTAPVAEPLPIYMPHLVLTTPRGVGGEEIIAAPRFVQRRTLRTPSACVLGLPLTPSSCRPGLPFRVPFLLGWEPSTLSCPEPLCTSPRPAFSLPLGVSCFLMGRITWDRPKNPVQYQACSGHSSHEAASLQVFSLHSCSGQQVG